MPKYWLKVPKESLDQLNLSPSFLFEESQEKKFRSLEISPLLLSV